MIRERLELHFDTLPEQSGQRSRLCGTVLSGLGVSRREPGCPGRAPGFLRRPLVFGLRKGAVWPDGADGSALPTKPVNSATRLARVMIAKMAASGPSSKKARASISEKQGPTCLRTESWVSSASVPGMEQLQHGRIRFATTDEAFFRQPIHAHIHTHPRQSAEELPQIVFLNETQRVLRLDRKRKRQFKLTKRFSIGFL